MTHDVFLSYSTEDLSAAEALCAALERRDIGVWMAPRDILPGLSWASSIIQGIDNARVMVLIFSSAANASDQIEREVQRALDKKLKVVPFRIEDVRPKDSLAYTIGNVQYLDALVPPMEAHYDRLSKVLRTIATLPLLSGPVPKDSYRPTPPEAFGVADRPNETTQPPTRVVDFLRGPYRMLADAVSAADPGDRILVRPGRYDGDWFWTNLSKSLTKARPTRS